MIKSFAVILSVVGLSLWISSLRRRLPSPASRMDFDWKFHPLRSRRRPADRTSTTPPGRPSISPTTGASTAPSIEDAPAAGGGGYLPTGIGWYRKTFQRPRLLQGQNRRHRVRRRLRKQRSLDQRPIPRQTPLRLHQLHLRSDPIPEFRPAGQHHRRPRRQFAAAQFPLVLRLRHLSPHLATRHRSSSTSPQWGTSVTTPQVSPTSRHGDRNLQQL